MASARHPTDSYIIVLFLLSLSTKHLRNVTRGEAAQDAEEGSERRGTGEVSESYLYTPRPKEFESDPFHTFSRPRGIMLGRGDEVSRFKLTRPIIHHRTLLFARHIYIGRGVSGRIVDVDVCGRRFAVSEVCMLM